MGDHADDQELTLRAPPRGDSEDEPKLRLLRRTGADSSQPNEDSSEPQLRVLRRLEGNNAELTGCSAFADSLAYTGSAFADSLAYSGDSMDLDDDAGYNESGDNGSDVPYTDEDLDTSEVVMQWDVTAVGADS